ncbi:hypothetical protein LOC68_04475 [Blastopirellula sp. JC732]|uniref:Uncharacterized protein n=1 Tax=Blastopirellula sediminis TaxID=2894196 RepID=A0A9X1MI59_9BACT|nr:hypothetical protein [Blastopirellula sediminis]MCC9609586.1 hypothetical protein [Blastopirellula sediminis]MCC9627638.1 hypothetical protein [Blastopirellula sediminis]
MFRLYVGMLSAMVCFFAMSPQIYAQFGGGSGERLGDGGGFGGGYDLYNRQPTPQVPSVQLTADYVNQPLPRLDQRRAMETKLQQRVNCQFTDMPLNVVIERLNAQAGVSLYLNNRALEDVGLSPDVPVTFNLRQIRLRTALQLMLRELDLTYLLDNERIEITTPEDAEDELRTLYYPCDDLMTKYEEHGFDFDSVIQLITTTVEPESWEELGGPGSIQPLNGGVVVAQTDEIHYRIARLFGALRRAKALSNDDYDPTAIEMGSQRFHRQQIEGKLSIVMPDLVVKDMPLERFAHIVTHRTGVQIYFNVRALEDVGLSTDVPVTGSWNNTTVLSALKDIYSQLELTGVYCDDLLEITTPEDAESELKRRVYPVRDFFAAENWVPGGDPFDSSVTGRRKAQRHYVADYDSLIGIITTTIDPDAWEELGGPCAVQPYADSDALVISATDEIHGKVDQLFREIRAGRVSPIPEPEEDVPQGAAALPTSDEIVDRTHRVEGEFDLRRLTEISQELQRAIAPGTWDGQKKYIVTLGTNQLVVRHNAQVQRDIRIELRRIALRNRPASPIQANQYGADPFAPRTMPGGGEGGFFQPNDNNRDPFGGDGGDPFGGSSNDPFGASNPFGGGDSDPFGSS